ncbi:MAG TPA: NAD(P)(+) transhydrogenase (Re/Si-specific) subunit beta [Blastocatellia bacterium]|nr:NAD(P)(+) transhydrogenase (Re/Si-specific) subunit beta [Blastocatellia bacterium]
MGLPIELTYLAASILFILGLKGLSHPESARRGMIFAEIGMLLAIVGTLLHREIVSYEWIIAGLIIGSLIGGAMSIWVPMTAMPQRTALSHAFGALAASLVGVSEYYRHGAGELGTFKMTALSLEVLLGGITVTGSLMAFIKLQDWIRGTPITYRGQNVFNMTLLALTVGMFVYLIFDPSAHALFYAMAGLAFVFGVLLVLPIGAADMPVVMSLMNSYAGLAAAATGFAISNNVLIIAGTLDGFSGFILSILMCRAMNRSITNVLFGAFGAETATAESGTLGAMREVKAEDMAVQLAYAGQVVFVPGYGMATAQAQHAVRELANILEARGVTVKYAIHPVAGRMPGHMNVLLAEANVPYSSLYDLEQINGEFPATDVAVVIGANDVVNPDARDNPKSPIAGMPILNVDRARSVVVLKRGKGKGFAGIENPLFFKPNCGMLYGDAKTSLIKLAGEVQNA